MNKVESSNLFTCTNNQYMKNFKIGAYYGYRVNINGLYVNFDEDELISLGDSKEFLDI